MAFEFLAGRDLVFVQLEVFQVWGMDFRKRFDLVLREVGNLQELEGLLLSLEKLDV